MAVNVPNVPGVPPVAFAAAAAPVTLLLSDAVGLFFGSPISPWGIYQNGSQVVTAETVLAFQYKQQWSLADFPIERGGFESYNKVQIPFDTMFRFVSGGSDANRQALLDSIAAIAGTTELYDIVTPTAAYVNVNIARYDYSQRSNDGVGLLQVDVYAQEIREANAETPAQTQSPTNAAQVNTGPVQTTAATSSQAAQAASVT